MNALSADEAVPTRASGTCEAEPCSLAAAAVGDGPHGASSTDSSSSPSFFSFWSFGAALASPCPAWDALSSKNLATAARARLLQCAGVKERGTTGPAIKYSLS